MNAKNENRLNMYLVVKDYLSTVPAATITSMPNFQEILTDFNANVLLIRDKSENQSASRIGYRMQKTTGKQETVLYALNMANCITAYAIATGNTVLQQSMKFTKSKLFIQRDTKTADDAQLILTKAVELQASLVPYGIAQPEIDKLTEVINDFNTNIPLPRVNINSRKLLTAEINTLLLQCDAQLIHMDKLVNIKQLTDETFFASYFYSRRIVNNHGRKLSIRGTIVNSAGIPIPSVLVSIPGLERETLTTSKGYYEFKNLPKGLQNIIFSRVDYTTTNRQAGIISGRRLQLNVILQAAASSQDVA
jgi:hypothetical protein